MNKVPIKQTTIYDIEFAPIYWSLEILEIQEHKNLLSLMKKHDESIILAIKYN